MALGWALESPYSAKTGPKSCRASGTSSSDARLTPSLGATWETPALSGLVAGGRHRIKTLAHLKGEANWWNNKTLIMNGFFHYYDAFGVLQRVNCIWVSLDAGETWSSPCFLDLPATDAGYGSLFYNPVTEELVLVAYQGTITKASLVQYNFKVNFN